MNAVSTERLIHDLRHVMREAEHVLAEAASETTDAALDMRSRAERGVRSAAARLEDAERTALRRARHTARRVDRYVHHKPWGALGAAAGLAFIAGALLARR